MSKRQSKVADVVIAGYGLSGGVAAIVAHDLGAKVLMLEKAKYPGGCSILSGGQIKCVRDVEGAVRYFKEMSGGRIDDELVVAFAEGLAGNEAFLRDLAKVNGARLSTATRRQGIVPGSGVYPYPGHDSLYSIRVASIPDFSGFPWVVTALPAGTAIMKLIMDNMESRGIEVLFQTPAKRLVADAQGALTGLIAETGDGEMEIIARRAVILATGGFEQNDWMRKQSLQGVPFYSMAPFTHTGDGITMAQKMGAAVWHMWHIHGSYGFKFPEHRIAFRHPFGGCRNPNRKMPWIVVDRFGSRYMDEYPPAPQDIAHRPMEIFNPDLPGYPRIPSYIVFDEDGRLRGPVAHPLAFEGEIYKWSKDNSEEIEKGWILTAPTLGELAQKIRGVPENGDLMDETKLESASAQWNEIVRVGKDPLGRPRGTMLPIKTPPFYAAQVWPVITNTQGGPVHNPHQRVMDSFGQPIPGLYATGELGSFFGHLYELEGNLGECVSSGRIAGERAARETPRN